MAVTTLDSITGLYLTYFDRVADPSGQNYWLGLANSGVSLSNIADIFGTSSEAQSVYPYLKSPTLQTENDFIDEIYTNNFSRTVGNSGLSYWSNLLNTGVVPPSQLPASISTSAAGTDLTALQNKVAISQNITQGLINYAIPITDSVLSRTTQILNSVDSSTESVVQANQTLCLALLTLSTDNPPSPIYVNPPQGDPISGFYVSYFGRAADPSGYQYWNQQLASGLSLEAIADSFGTSTEAQTLYPYLKTPPSGDASTFIESIYQNSFAHAADTNGLNYWTSLLSANPAAASQFPYSLTSAAQGADVVAFTNKVAFARTFTNSLINYGITPTDAILQNSVILLSSVDSTPQSVVTANQELCSVLINQGTSAATMETIQLDANGKMIPGDCGCGQDENDSLTAPSTASNTIGSARSMDAELIPMSAGTLAASLSTNTGIYSGTSDSAKPIVETALMMNTNHTEFPISSSTPIFI